MIFFLQKKNKTAHTERTLLQFQSFFTLTESTFFSMSLIGKIIPKCIFSNLLPFKAEITSAKRQKQRQDNAELIGHFNIVGDFNIQMLDSMFTQVPALEPPNCSQG